MISLKNIVYIVQFHLQYNIQIHTNQMECRKHVEQVWRGIAFKRDKHDTLKYVICID